KLTIGLIFSCGHGWVDSMVHDADLLLRGVVEVHEVIRRLPAGNDDVARGFGAPTRRQVEHAALAGRMRFWPVEIAKIMNGDDRRRMIERHHMCRHKK